MYQNPSGSHRIVFIGRALNGGGAERVTRDLAASLAVSGDRVALVHLFDSPSPLEYPPAVEIAGPVYRPRVPPLAWRIARRLARMAGRPVRTPIGAARFGELAADLRVTLAPLAPAPETILVPVMEEAMILCSLAGLASRHRVVAWLHTVESYAWPHVFPDPDDAAAQLPLFRAALSQVEAVVVPSAGCADDLARLTGLSPARVATIGNPIDLAGVTQAGAVPAPETRGAFLYVGRLAPEKDVDLLLDAAKIAAATRSDFRVALAGTGPLEQALRARVAREGLAARVAFLGHLRDPFPAMAGARAVVLCSQYESFGMTLLEAQALGVQAIALDCPYGPRAVLDGGRAGVLVEERSPRALAHAMLAAMDQDDAADSRRTVGRLHAAEFDAPRIARRWRALFDSLTAGLPT
jgi:glycosyltransferase involved in cell wall biosynthesis